MSGCAHSNDYDMPISPGELCPVDEQGQTCPRGSGAGV